MKIILVRSLVSVLLSAVAVASGWLAWDAARGDVSSVQSVLNGIAWLPVALFIRTVASLAYCGLPLAAALAAYAWVARSRPALGRAFCWIPISVGVGFLAGGAGVGTYGTSWSFFYSGDSADDWLSSMILGMAMSIGSFIFYRYRLVGTSPLIQWKGIFGAPSQGRRAAGARHHGRDMPD